MSDSTCPTVRRSLLMWLARGGIGFTLLVGAAWMREPLVVIPALLAALIAFRGCPMCWAFELMNRGARDTAPLSRKDTP